MVVAQVTMKELKREHFPLAFFICLLFLLFFLAELIYKENKFKL